MLFFSAESDKLQVDFQKVEQLEDKITTELVMLKEKNANMENELETYSDLDKLRDQSEKKRKVIYRTYKYIGQGYLFVYSNIKYDQTLFEVYLSR